MKSTLLAVLSALACALPAGAQTNPDPNFTLRAESLQENGALAPYENLLRAPALLGLSAQPGGAVFANLRGLGLGNSLVLINGRRAFGFSNLNALPLAAIARVDVYKDGYGAVFGDGATGGALNFITYNGPGEQKFVGTEIDLLFGFSGRKGGGDFRAGSFVSGFANDKLSIVVAGAYSSQDAVPSRIERKQFYAGFEAPISGRAARVYGDILQSNTRAGSVDLRSTRSTAGLRGDIGTSLGSVSYDVGAMVERSRLRE